MELKITEKTEKPLMFRAEIIAEAFFDGKTPSKDSIKKEIVKHAKADESLVVIKKVKTYFGLRKIKALAFVYNNKEDLDKIEPRKKKNGEAGENTEETSKEAPKEEKKEEPKKEENPAQEKKE